MTAMPEPAPREPTALERTCASWPAPVFVLSTRVGRGMQSLGDALAQRLGSRCVAHETVEDHLPGRALAEDLRHYRNISCRFPALLHVAYRFPPIYWRKLWRERRLAPTALHGLADALRGSGARTIIGVSHRPTFWAAFAALRHDLQARLVGVLGEYGSNLGWRYQPWQRIDGFLTPVTTGQLRFRLPSSVQVTEIDLPARAEFTALSGHAGEPRRLLVVCGMWGQGRIDRVVGTLRQLGAAVDAVCGENDAMLDRLRRRFGDDRGVTCHGVVPSLAPLMARCRGVVTKPGIATITEAHAAGRQIFLLSGMPVAEDNNARYALDHLGAVRFSQPAVRRWLEGEG